MAAANAYFRRADIEIAGIGHTANPAEPGHESWQGRGPCGRPGRRALTRIRSVRVISLHEPPPVSYPPMRNAEERPMAEPPVALSFVSGALRSARSRRRDRINRAGCQPRAGGKARPLPRSSTAGQFVGSLGPARIISEARRLERENAGTKSGSESLHPETQIGHYIALLSFRSTTNSGPIDTAPECRA